MSAGSFVTSRYESNGGGIFKVRVQPETIDAVIGAVSNGRPLERSPRKSQHSLGEVSDRLELLREPPL